MDEIRFYHQDKPYGFFSNFSAHPIERNGKLWPTTEHYFQAQKFAGTEHEEAVRLAKTSMQAATMGRDRALPFRLDWNVVKDDIMRDALRAKFTQHAVLRTELLATGDATLIEHTKNDSYWGDGGDGSGKNILGELLMEVREELRSVMQEPQPMSSATMSSSDSHRAQAAARGPIPVAVVTVSDTRTLETDTSGTFLRQAVEAAGHRVAAYKIVRDEPAQIAALLDEMTDADARIVLFNGGTGISSRDTTFDAIHRKLEKTLPGFGELFRMFSYEQVGAAAMLSRAVAGVYRGRVIVSMPGSPDAVRLAWEKLLAPELAHLAWEVAR